MRLFIAILTVFGVFVVLAILFAYVQLAYYTPSGFREVSPDDVVKPMVLSAFSLLGILSKSVFSALQEKGGEDIALSTLIKSLSLGGILRALLICPIVIISFYNSLQQIGDMILVALMAYQNAFFFEAVLQSRESRVREDG